MVLRKHMVGILKPHSTFAWGWRVEFAGLATMSTSIRSAWAGLEHLTSGRSLTPMLPVAL